MKKFTKIRQYIDVINVVKSRCDYIGRDANNKPIYIKSDTYPIVDYLGTVKLDGDNASVRFDSGGVTTFGSRYNVVTEQKDEINFWKFASTIDWFYYLPYLEGFTIYGEWCSGEDNNITAIHRLGGVYVIFAIRSDVTGNYLSTSYLETMLSDKLTKLNSENVWVITQFPTYEVTIDFNNPDKVLEYINQATKDVELSCPVAKKLGVDGVGEGIVWSPVTGYEANKQFKTKGKMHNVTRRKDISKTDLEKIETVKEFVNNTCTDNRLKQGVTVLKLKSIPITNDNIGAYIKWVVGDILDEERLLLDKSGLSKTDVSRAISKRAMDYWLKLSNKEYTYV